MFLYPLLEMHQSGFSWSIFTVYSVGFICWFRLFSSSKCLLYISVDQGPLLLLLVGPLLHLFRCCCFNKTPPGFCQVQLKPQNVSEISCAEAWASFLIKQEFQMCDHLTVCVVVVCQCGMWCCSGACHCNSHNKSDFWKSVRNTALLGELQRFNLTLSEVDHHLRNAGVKRHHVLKGVWSF